MQKNIFHTSLVRLASTVANFLLVFIVARYLGPNAKGIATIMLTTISFVVFFSSIIGGQSYIYLIPKLKFEALVIPAILWSLLISISAFLLLSFLNLTNMQGAAFIAVIALLMALNNVLTTLFLAKQRWTLFNVLQSFPVLFTLLITALLFFVFHQRTLHVYLLAMVISYTFTILLGLWFIREEFTVTNLSQTFEEVETLFRYGLSYQLLDLLQLLNLRFYFFMLHHLQGNADLGYFSVGISLFESCWIFARSVQTVAYSRFVSFAFSFAIAMEVIRYVKFSVFISCIIAAVLLVLPNSFYLFVFGEAYVGVNWSLKWFVPGVVAYNVYLILQSYYLAKGKYTGLILMNVVGFIFSLLGCYSWIPMRYFTGAAAAASMSFLLCAGGVYIMFCRENQLPLSVFLPNRDDITAFKKAVTTLFGKSVVK
ncbi:MAG: oligosaccharide flippase family protein [Chitinophagales bacterium]|nr:oligosaccharide flippase family protein [Chitinophagales bacterium]